VPHLPAGVGTGSGHKGVDHRREQFYQSAADLVVAVPFTTRRRGVPTHVEVRPPAGGLRDLSFAMCEQIRSLSTERLGSRSFGL
jgi:mRNA-degrading endonuclease toxin of MazEF toxin-antitoxin module